MAQTQREELNKGIWVNKLPKSEQNEVLKAVTAMPELREMLRSNGGTFEFTFEYPEGDITKFVELPARYSWPTAAVIGGCAVKLPSSAPQVHEDDEVEVKKPSSNRKFSSEEKSEEEKRVEKREKNMEMHRTSISRSVVNFIFALVTLLIVGMLTGIIPSVFAQKTDVSGKINSANLGFIDTNCDGIEDENAAAIAAQDSYYRTIYNKQKAVEAHDHRYDNW